jgi:uncharacterized protein (TIGR03067 family)
MMKSHMLWVVLIVPFLAADTPTDAAKKDSEKLQGSWIMTALEVEGKALTEEKYKDVVLEIKGERYVVTTGGKSHEVTFTLDAIKSPKEIDLLFPDDPIAPKRHKGIYELEGDTFRLCKHYAAEEERPRDFVSTSGSGRFIATWTRRARQE